MKLPWGLSWFDVIIIAAVVVGAICVLTAH
jgi:hypothetical protein